MFIVRTALDIEGKIIFPFRTGQRATCGVCKSDVISKCGEIIKWHWSHLVDRNCDTWYEHLTPWHIQWQDLLKNFRVATIEVPIEKWGVIHRADAVLPDGRVFELQHSGISPEQIRERELYYGEKMVWIFDARDAFENSRIDLRKKGERDTFRWKQPKKSIAYASRKVFLDLGEGMLFELEWMSKETPCGGVGILHKSEYLYNYT